MPFADPCVGFRRGPSQPKSTLNLNAIGRLYSVPFVVYFLYAITTMNLVRLSWKTPDVIQLAQLLLII